jgi:hypothetical protein
LETEIRAKQNPLYKGTSTTQIPLPTSSQSNEGTTSHTGSTSYQTQETLDAEDLETHSVMLEVYHIHPSKQNNIHPKDGSAKLPTEIVAPTTSPRMTLTLGNPKRVMREKPHIMKDTSFIQTALPPLEHGRGGTNLQLKIGKTPPGKDSPGVTHWHSKPVRALLPH